MPAKERARTALIKLLCGPNAHYRHNESFRRRNKSSNSEIKRVLVVRPDHLGDLLFATPSLERIRKAFPGAHITGLVGPWGKAMWDGNPSLNSLDTIRFPGIAGDDKANPLAPYFWLSRYARKLFQKQYDLAVVLRFDHWWGAALLWAAGIPRRWGYDTPGMRAWLTDYVPYTLGLHEVIQDLAITDAMLQAHAGPSRLQRIGQIEIEQSQGKPRLRPPHPEPLSTNVADNWLARPQRVVIHPGTAAANKLWTIEGWAEVARRLATQGWSVALTGSPGEVPLSRAIQTRVGEGQPIHNLAGETANLGQLVWVLEQAHMVLGVDSGPLHIADALGKPTVHLYGPSDETIWGPWGDPGKHRTLRAPGTHPTMHLDVGSTALEGGPEMQAITVDMVIKSANIEF